MLVLLGDTRRSGRACRFAPTSFTNKIQGLFIPDSLCWTVMDCGWTCSGIALSPVNEARLDFALPQLPYAATRRSSRLVRIHSTALGNPIVDRPRTPRNSKKKVHVFLGSLSLWYARRNNLVVVTGRRLPFRSALAMFVHLRIVRCQSETARTKYNYARLCCSLRIVLSCHRGFLSPN